jgi:hypothetical protein
LFALYHPVDGLDSSSVVCITSFTCTLCIRRPVSLSVIVSFECGCVVFPFLACLSRTSLVCRTLFSTSTWSPTAYVVCVCSRFCFCGPRFQFPTQAVPSTLIRIPCTPLSTLPWPTPRTPNASPCAIAACSCDPPAHTTQKDHSLKSNLHWHQCNLWQALFVFQRIAAHFVTDGLVQEGNTTLASHQQPSVMQGIRDSLPGYANRKRTSNQ